MKYRLKVGAIIINTDGNVLLQEEYSQKKKGYFYNIVKGTVDENDISIKHTLFREIYEESGLLQSDISNYDIYKTYISEKEGYVSILITFIVYLKDNFKGKISNLNNEVNEDIKDYYWFSRKEIIGISKEKFFDERIFILFQDICIENE